MTFTILEFEVLNFPPPFSANKPAARCEAEWLQPRLVGGVS